MTAEVFVDVERIEAGIVGDRSPSCLPAWVIPGSTVTDLVLPLLLLVMNKISTTALVLREDQPATHDRFDNDTSQSLPSPTLCLLNGLLLSTTINLLVPGANNSNRRAGTRSCFARSLPNRERTRRRHHSSRRLGSSFRT